MLQRSRGNAGWSCARVKATKIHTKNKINYKFMTRHKTHWNCTLRKNHLKSFNISQFKCFNKSSNASFGCIRGSPKFNAKSRESILFELALTNGRSGGTTSSVIHPFQHQIKLLKIANINDFKFTLSAVTSIAFKPSEDIMSAAPLLDFTPFRLQ